MEISPVPWFAGKFEEYVRDSQGKRYQIFGVWSRDGGRVAICNGVRMPNEQNAKLMAAAPDLLAELKHTAYTIQSRMSQFPNVNNLARSEQIEYQVLVEWLNRTNQVINKAEKA